MVEICRIYLACKQLKMLELRKEPGCWSAELIQRHVHSIDDGGQVCWGTCANKAFRVEAVAPPSTPFNTILLCKLTERRNR